MGPLPLCVWEGCCPFPRSPSRGDQPWLRFSEVLSSPSGASCFRGTGFGEKRMDAKTGNTVVQGFRSSQDS